MIVSWKIFERSRVGGGREDKKPFLNVHPLLIKVEKQIILSVGNRKEWVFPSYSRSKPQNGSILKYFYIIKKRIGYH